MGDFMTYPTRQWTPEQQDAIARVQSLIALLKMRNEVVREFTEVDPQDVTPHHKPVSGERD